MRVTQTMGGSWTAVKVGLPSNGDSTSDNQNAVLSDVTCTTATDCVAVGYYTDTTDGDSLQAMVETETGGTWTANASEITEPTDAPSSKSSQSAVLSSVTCTSTGNCVAVGQYYGGT
jgi:hypothetical protein